MEKMIIRRQISYKCIFPNGKDKLENVLKKIPSKSAIAWASYMLTKRSMKTQDQNELGFFMPLLFKMNKELQNSVMHYLEEIANDIGSYDFLDEVSLLIFIEYLLENHNGNNTDILTSKDDFSNMFIAYLLCCDERLSYSPESILNINSCNDLMKLHLPEQLRINDILYSKDYRIEFLKFYYFMRFCEIDKTFDAYITLFMNENNIDKWDDYLYFVFNLYLRLCTNEEGATNLIILGSDNCFDKRYLNFMSVDIARFKRSSDFQSLRSKPVYYHGNNKYSIIYTSFFIDKMFQSFLFDLSSVLIKNRTVPKINSYPNLKQMIGEHFTEHYLFYEIMSGCFINTHKKLISGQDLKEILKDGEPDYYLRSGRNIFIFEFKDVMLNAKTKHCKNFEQIKSEILQLFESSTIEKSTGKLKKHPQAKGITQLLNIIESKLDIILQSIDKVESINGYNVYPIIVYQDCSFDIEGVNYILNGRFEELKKEREISNSYCIKNCVMISLPMMMSLEDYFGDGRLKLGDLIDDYIQECSLSDQNKRLPFNKYIMRQAWKLGYKNQMSKRFKNISDLLIEKNSK